MSLANAAVAAGSLLIVGDYLDRKYSFSKDLRLLPKVIPMQLYIKNFIKNNNTVADTWEETCKKHGSKEFILFEDRVLTFKQVDQEANRVAHWIASKGFKTGDVVALYMENKPEFVITWLGLCKAGLIIAFINCNLVGKGFVHCVKISNAKMLIFGQESANAIADNKDALFQDYTTIPLACYGGAVDFAEHIDEQIRSHSPETPPRSVRKAVKSSDTWGFVYTSGTTGLPKAAIIRHVRFLSGGLFASLYGVQSTDRVYTVLPLYHSAGGMIGVGMSIFTGAAIVLKRKFSASQFIGDIRKYECTVFQYIGELCRYLLALPSSPEDTNHKLRIAIGNGLRPDIWENFQNRFKIPFIGEFYAATEGNAALFNEVGLDGEGRGAVGRMGLLFRTLIPVKILKFDLVTEEPIRGPNGLCIECADGEAGELVGLIDESDPTRQFAGYYSNKAGNEKKVLQNVFVKGDRYFRTGDLLKRDSKGYYYFVDRIGDTFRWKGENVSTTEVAEALSVFPGIKEANVYGVSVPGKDGRAGMAAIVAEDTLDFAGLGKHVTKDLPSYAIPLFLRKIPEVEITGTFKHRKVELRDQGFDPAVIQDPLYIFNPTTKSYEPLTAAQYEQIVSGKSKL